MTILTCAWMEREWVNGLHPMDRLYFKGARYMDDILIFLSKTHKWDHVKFLEDFARSECYWKPLKLENAGVGQFLETSYEKVGQNVTYRLKNANEVHNNVWRYHHYQSRMDYTTKRSTLLSSLRKTFTMASDNEQCLIGLEAKCKEFLLLGYPVGIIRHMCSRLFYETNAELFQILRSLLPVEKGM